MSNTNDSHGDSKTIFEDDDWLIITPLDYESYTYTSPDNLKSEWNRFRDGDIFFIVDKNNNATYAGGFKTYMIYIEEDTTYYYNWNGKELKTKKRFTRDFPPHIVQQVNDIIGNSPLYDLLVRIINGEEITKRQLTDADELISDYRPSRNNPKKGILTIQFYDDDEFLELFDLDEDDKWAYDTVTSHYVTYEFRDSWSYEEDWKEGYLLPYFNQENRERLKEILSLISPNLLDYEEDDDKTSEVSQLLTKLFDDEVESIIYEIMSEENIAKTRGFKEDVEYQVCNEFVSYGFFTKTCMRKYFTSVMMLMSFYKSVGDTTLTLTELMKSVVEDQTFGWSDSLYEVQPVDLDEEAIQREIERSLDKMMEKLEGDSEFLNVLEYSEIFKRVTSRYQLNNRYETKYGKEFFVRGIEPSTNKIIIEVFKKDNGGLEERSYTEEEFENFLVSPELFEIFIRNK
jgi:hypothetical protein